MTHAARSISIDSLLAKAVEHLRERQTRLPESTYRVQFHAGFTFRHATAIVPYLADLGITHLYASPYMAARKGSTHGYDVIDPTCLNPELGTPDDYAALCASLADRGMGQILDTVPNHMGVGTNENAWWNDVLEHGPESAYGGFFDIAWNAPIEPENKGKVTLPILGDPLDETLAKGDLKLSMNLATGTFAIDYFERKLPVSPQSYPTILEHRLAELKAALGEGHAELTAYQAVLNDPAFVVQASRLHAAGTAAPQSADLKDLLRRNAPIREHVERTVRDFNSPSKAGDRPLLRNLLSRQHYRLLHWRLAPEQINYRRFFDINDLAALSMEKREVFEAVHTYTLRLIADGNIAGLRVDHPDGLYDPKAYFLRLQQYAVLACAEFVFKTDAEFAAGDWSAARESVVARLADPSTYTGRPGADRWPLYVSVEKILAPNEPLPPDWAVHGTSGYDALNMISGLYVDPKGENALSDLSSQYADSPGSYADLVDEKKKRMLRLSFSGELARQAAELHRIASAAWSMLDVETGDLQNVLQELIAAFPVYRSYISAEAVPANSKSAYVRPEDEKLIDRALTAAQKRNPSLLAAAVNVVQHVLLQRLPRSSDDSLRAAALAFVGRFQQLTAPVTAKGIEDTAFYVYNRLISMNEVGGEPGVFGVAPEKLHAYFADRQSKWPYALTPLSTHDTKRSEDVRVRIHALSESPEEWRSAVALWFAINAHHRATVEGRQVPTANEEYWIYQTLVGVWPFEHGDQSTDDLAGENGLIPRVQAYLKKAMREAKVYTDWTEPNQVHEQAVETFIDAILDPKANAHFFESFLPFQRRIAQLGTVNSLSQTLLQMTAPGVPDTYQGTELWDLSLVDPDNRRPVDYEKRKSLLHMLRRQSEREPLSALCADLLKTPDDGRIKLYLTWRLLSARKSLPGLFSVGKYVPVPAKGAKADHLFAFARSLGSASALVIAPRLSAGVTTNASPWPIDEAAFGNTQLVLPKSLVGQTLWNLLTGESLVVSDVEVLAARLLRLFPVGLWVTDHV